MDFTTAKDGKLVKRVMKTYAAMYSIHASGTGLLQRPGQKLLHVPQIYAKLFHTCFIVLAVGSFQELLGRSCKLGTAAFKRVWGQLGI